MLNPRVQAFCLSACCPGGHAYEAVLAGTGSQKKSGPALRRGVLTHCLLRALEDMNFRCTFYELWMKAVHILRSKRITDQHFQLCFSDIADPIHSDAFRPLSFTDAWTRLRQAGVEAGSSMPLVSCCTA